MREQILAAGPTKFGLILVAICVAFMACRAPLAVAQEASQLAEDSPSSPDPPDDARGDRDLVASLTIFVLAVFVGFEVITKVPPTLHTPLMSGSNAISGITLVGAIIVASSPLGGVSPALGFLAVTLATINAVGGFLVTHRMLAMFKKK